MNYSNNTFKLLMGIWIMLALNCSKEKIDSDYEGTWKCQEGGLLKIFEINSSSTSHYSECDACPAPICNCFSESNGQARIKGNKLHIGLTRFSITKKPADEGNGKWTMVLEKSKFTASKLPKTIDYCNDGIKNNGEAGIDCGGSCENPCYDKAGFKLDNIASFYTDRLTVFKTNNYFSIHSYKKPFDTFDPIPGVELHFKATAEGSYLLDSTSCFSMGVVGGNTYYYYCVSGTIQVDSLDQLNHIISIKYNFHCKNKMNGREVDITNGIISNLIY